MAVRVTLLAALLAGAAAVVGVGGRAAAPLAVLRTALSGGLLLAFLWYTGARTWHHQSAEQC